MKVEMESEGGVKEKGWMYQESEERREGKTGEKCME
jgi:hypothetical protein